MHILVHVIVHIVVLKRISLLNKYKDKCRDKICLRDMIIMRLLFNVADRGDRYEFISANTNELAFAGSTNDIIEVPSWEVYEAIVEYVK